MEIGRTACAAALYCASALRYWTVAFKRPVSACKQYHKNYFYNLGNKEINCNFKDVLHNLFYFPQNAVYFIMFFCIQTILTFFINRALKFKHKRSRMKGPLHVRTSLHSLCYRPSAYCRSSPRNNFIYRSAATWLGYVVLRVHSCCPAVSSALVLSLQ